MAHSKLVCPKCGGKMERGFLVDTIFPGSAAMEPQGEQLLWAKGKRSAVQKPGWFSRLTSGIGFLLSQADTLKVSSDR